MKNLIIILSLLIFASCNTKKNVTEQANIANPQIENTHWSLIELDGKPIPTAVAGKVHILLSEKDKKLSGSNGCNRLMGSYEISHELQISFLGIASTRMIGKISDDFTSSQFFPELIPIFAV